MLDIYLEHGGNFVDTASGYTNGRSEKILGDILGERRERIVLSTKYTFNLHPGDPNAGGNHRMSMVRAVETSLSRMKTDRIDLLYLHAGTTRPRSRKSYVRWMTWFGRAKCFTWEFRYDRLANCTNAGDCHIERMVAADRAAKRI